MRCFLCSRDSSSSSSSDNNRKNSTNNNRNNRRDDHAQPPQDRQRVSPDNLVNQSAPENTEGESSSSHEKAIDKTQARTFTFDVLVAATQNFKEEYFLGEGGFGKVYKGRLPDTHEIVAVKQLDRSGCQGVTEFVVEVVTLSSAHHENLVKLIGYCVEGAQRLLVYEYMPLGALDEHIHDTGPHRKVMDWCTRMKVAAGAARGLEYLHNKMTPPIIYRDLKCSNILLGDGYHPKLSDFGLAKVGPQGDKTHVSTRVMGTYGYCAPEYAMTGQLTYKSDIFSFGVVLLELISGRKAIDNRRPSPEQNLVSWARPLFKDRKKFYKMVDPALQGEFPIRGLYQALAIAAMCVQEQPTMRPQTSDIVTALNYLASQTYDPQTTTQSRSSPSSRRTSRKDGDQNREEDESTRRKDGEQSNREEDESVSRKDSEQSKREEDESTSRKDGEQSKSEEDESTNDPNTTQSRSSPSSSRTSRKEDVDQCKREEDGSTKSD